MHMYVKVSPSSSFHKETPATAQPLPPGRAVFPFLSGTLVLEFCLTECKGRGSNSFLWECLLTGDFISHSDFLFKIEVATHSVVPVYSFM